VTKPIYRITDRFVCRPHCLICGGTGIVCENHPDKSWPEECRCGAGEPCPHAVDSEQIHGQD